MNIEDYGTSFHIINITEISCMKYISNIHELKNFLIKMPKEPSAHFRVRHNQKYVYESLII